MSSTVSIPTTFVGSLPRSADHYALLLKRTRGEDVEPERLHQSIQEAVRGAVEMQHRVGLTYLSDGEQGEIGYLDPLARCAGFAPLKQASVNLATRDMLSHPEYMQQMAQSMVEVQPALEAHCVGPISYHGEERLRQRIDIFRQALSAVSLPAERGFLTCPSPGTLASYFSDDYYHDAEPYLYALADALHEEYRIILDAGFWLQVDCPDFGCLSGSSLYSGIEDKVYLTRIRLHCDALKHALAGLPAERIRIHACYGNYNGPHESDSPLSHVLDLFYTLPASVLLFVGANGRHHWEWRAFRDHPLPAGMRAAPGVVDPTTNILEHQETIAEYLESLAQVVGAERIIASSDCGFGTLARHMPVAPDIVVDKLRVLVQGAALASQRLSTHEGADLSVS